MNFVEQVVNNEHKWKTVLILFICYVPFFSSFTFLYGKRTKKNVFLSLNSQRI